MRAREDDLRSTRRGFDFQQQGAHAVVDAEAFIGDHLRPRHDPFSFHLQTQRHTLGIDRLHHAADDLAHLFAG